MHAYRYVLVGGGVASERAAEAIRARDAEGSIVIIAAEPHLPYQRPPLSKAFLLRPRAAELAYVKSAAFYARMGVDVWRGARCAGIDRERRLLTLDDGRQVGYEKLLLATGARPFVPPVPGCDLEGVHTLLTIEDSVAIREAATAGSRALVVGGGFIGSEVAASLVQRGVGVTMAYMEQRLQQRIVPPALSDLIERRYTDRGVRLVRGCAVTAFQGEGRVTTATLSTGESLSVDLVVIGAGVRPNVALARQAGLVIDASGGVAVDDHLRTDDPSIYAAGDVASWPDRTFGKRLRVEHLDVARRQGATAGTNMAGGDEAYSAMPYFFTSLFDLPMDFWGDLSAWDTTVQRGDLAGGHFAFFYFCDEAMVGAMAANAGKEERRAMPLIVSARPVLERVAARLADAELPLAEVLP